MNLGTLVPRTNALSIRPQHQPCIFLWSVSSGCLGACQFSTPNREKTRQIPRFWRARHGKGLPRNPLRLFKSTHAGQRFGDVARWILREFRGLEGSASQTHHKMHGSARVLRQFRGLEGSASQTHHKMHGSARVLRRFRVGLQFHRWDPSLSYPAHTLGRPSDTAERQPVLPLASHIVPQCVPTRPARALTSSATWRAWAG